MSDFKLYAIELENRKVFLQVSIPISEELLLQQCRVMVKFVNDNPPIKIIHTIDIDDVLKINYWVKYFMRYYGIDNVRGGNYIDEILSPELMQFLRMEIGATFDDYEDDVDVFENVLTECFAKESRRDSRLGSFGTPTKPPGGAKPRSSLDVVRADDLRSDCCAISTDDDKKKLENRLSDYKSRQILLEYSQVYDGLLEDLEWVKNEITNTRLIYDIPDKIKNGRGFNVLFNYYSVNRLCVNTYDKDRYKTILKRLKEFIDNYYSLSTKDEKDQKYYCDAYLRNKLRSFNEVKDDKSPLVLNPAFTLDNFFLHPHVITNWEFQVQIVNELIDKWLSMYYSIKNWRDEIEFDLSSYPKDFEKHTQYALRFMDIYKAMNQ